MISIIVPVWNEQETIATLLTSLQNLAGSKEIIVVDATSTDKTKELAQNKAQVVSCTVSSRAAQMNKGASLAKGDILWFVHADTKVPTTSLMLIKKALKQHAYGCFALSFFDSQCFSLKLIAYFSNLRVKCFSLIFGDQAMFIRKEFFLQLGGFTQMELMEDFEFSMRAKKIVKPVILKTKIGTSARKFLRGGIWRTCLLMQKIKFFYLLGTPSAKLKELYTRK